MVISPVHDRKLSLTNLLLQMLVVFQLVKDVMHFMVLGDFFTIFTSACHLTCLVQFTFLCGGEIEKLGGTYLTPWH